MNAPTQQTPRKRYYNMDVVRYILATYIIFYHTFVLTGYFAINWFSIATAVGAFFALSGFLAYPSYSKRKNALDFIRHRLVRLMPSYLIVVFACAFGLCIASSLSPAEYFSSSQFWKYLISNAFTLNFLEPSLPGVFDGPQFAMSAVDGALWTMKVEILLTLTVPLVAWLERRFPGRRNVILLSVILLSAAYKLVCHSLYESTGREIYAIAYRQLFGEAIYFYCGALLSFHLDWLGKRVGLAWFIVGLTVMASYFIYPDVEATLLPFAVSLVIIRLSVVGSWGKSMSRHDNVSYDMFLFHWPIIQICVLIGIPQYGATAVASFVLAATIGIAFLSWNCLGRAASHWLSNRFCR